MEGHLLDSHETMDFGKIFMRQGILLGNFLSDRVQGVERFATHPRHCPSQVPSGHQQYSGDLNVTKIHGCKMTEKA